MDMKKSLWLGVVSSSLAVCCAQALAQSKPSTAFSWTEVPSGLSPHERSQGSTAKLDTALIRLRANPQNLKRAAGASNAAVEDAGSVKVDVVAQGSVQETVAKLEQLGFRTTAVYRNYISGRLPVASIDRAAALTSVRRINKVASFTRSGSVQGQGDYAQLSRSLRAAVRSDGGQLNGKGITVGILSDSFNCNAVLNDDSDFVAAYGHQDELQDDIATGDLPAAGRTRILKEFSDCASGYGGEEGRAMAEIVHDVAPGAQIAFYTASDGQADFAQGIETLALPKNKTDANGIAGGGAQVIVDDIGYFAEPAFQSGVVGAAIDDVVEHHDVAYFSAAGNANDGLAKINYVNNDASFAQQPVAPGGLGEGGRPLNVAPSAEPATYIIPVHALSRYSDAPLWPFQFQLYWDQPFDDSASSLQVCLGDAQGKPLHVTYQGELLPNCTDASVIGQQALSLGRLTSDTSEATLRITLLDGPAPRRVHLLTSNVVLDRFGTADASVYGHALSANAIATGAANYLDTPQCDSGLRVAKLENFSSHGGSLQVFDNSGERLAQPRLDGKPDLVAPDGASSVFFGSTASDAARGFSVSNLNCRYYHNSPWQFFGTSAAAPHAAAVAALLRQAAPEASAQDIYQSLRKTAQPMGSSGVDHANGAGFIQPSQAYLYLTKSASE